MESPLHRDPLIRRRALSRAQLAFAKELRRAMTSEERLLWHGLRRNQLGGLHFRRQQVIGEFVLDFYCHRARLAVEVDGGAHDTQGGRDERRDATLRRLGIEVVRVPCDAVRREPDLVLGMIREEAEKRVRVRVRRT